MRSTSHLIHFVIHSLIYPHSPPQVRSTSPLTELRGSPEIVWGSEREEAAAAAGGGARGGGSDDEGGGDGDEDARDDDVGELVRLESDAQDTPNGFRDDQTAVELQHLHAIVAELCEAVDMLEARKESLERKLRALKER